MVEALFETDTAGALGLYEGDFREEMGASARVLAAGEEILYLCACKVR